MEHKGDIIITVIIVLEVGESQNYLAAKKYFRKSHTGLEHMWINDDRIIILAELSL